MMSNSDARKRATERAQEPKTAPLAPEQGSEVRGEGREDNGPQIGELRIEPDYADSPVLWHYRDADDERPTPLLWSHQHSSAWPAVVRTVEKAAEVEILRRDNGLLRLALNAVETSALLAERDAARAALAAVLADIEANVGHMLATVDPLAARGDTMASEAVRQFADMFAAVLAKHAPADAPVKEAER